MHVILKYWMVAYTLSIIISVLKSPDTKDKELLFLDNYYSGPILACSYELYDTGLFLLRDHTPKLARHNLLESSGMAINYNLRIHVLRVVMILELVGFATLIYTSFSSFFWHLVCVGYT